jgi:endonuclease III
MDYGEICNPNFFIFFIISNTMENIEKIYSILKKEIKNYKVPVVDLIKIKTKSPFKILIATILSARTRDETTIKVCKKLFNEVKNFNDLEKLSVKKIEKLIYPIGFYKNKSKQLKRLPEVIFNEFDGKIPQKIDELIKLPGVGRKTANLVRITAFDKYGICVDTHVHRIFNRFGYIKTNTPYETEINLREKLPKKYWKEINYLLVSYGQNTCTPISPFCSNCVIKKYCKRVNVNKSR